MERLDVRFVKIKVDTECSPSWTTPPSSLSKSTISTKPTEPDGA
jgi:hypothetical protein